MREKCEPNSFNAPNFFIKRINSENVRQIRTHPSITNLSSKIILNCLLICKSLRQPVRVQFLIRLRLCILIHCGRYRVVSHNEIPALFKTNDLSPVDLLTWSVSLRKLGHVFSVCAQTSAFSKFLSASPNCRTGLYEHTPIVNTFH